MNQRRIEFYSKVKGLRKGCSFTLAIGQISILHYSFKI